MNLKNTSTSTLSRSAKFLTTLLLLCLSSPSSAQHHQPDLREGVKDIVTFTEKKPELSADACSPESDPAFVNFDPRHLKDPKGFHGMLFFGSDETFYISHLPMFHKPHDYQAIVEVRLRPEAKARYQAALKASGGYFTFSPSENFVLPDQLINKRPISGALVQGHFERGGAELLSTELELVRVVFYKKLSPDEKKPLKNKYVIFGKGSEYFMAHEVSGRPDVDEIIPIPENKLLPQKLKEEIVRTGLARTDEVELTSKSKSNGLSRASKSQSMKGKIGKEMIEFEYKEFYRETGDLQ